MKLLGFYRLEPTGGRAENVRFGMLMALLTKLKYPKSSSKVTVNDFFPDGPEGEPKKKATSKKRIDWRVMKARLMSGMFSMGFPVGKAKS